MSGRVKSLLVPSLVVSLWLAPVAIGGTAAANLASPSPGGHFPGGGWTLGWSFVPTTRMAVTGLGAYDQDRDGLHASAEIGIFASDRALLASATVPAGEMAPLDGFFRYVSIPPLELLAGRRYFLGSRVEDSTLATWLGGSTFTFHPHISQVEGRYQTGSGLAFPATTSPELAGNPYFGPNFRLAICGDGRAEPGEECDDGPDNGTTASCCSLLCTAIAAGSSCDDADACTQNDRCDGYGTCVGTDPVECTAFDQCHEAGTCDASTGTCDDPVKADGSACDDADVCTAGDVCQAGSCEPGAPVLENPLADPNQTLECLVQRVGALP